MGLVLLVVLVFVLAAAAYVDHRDRKHGYQRRSAADMISRRRERVENLKSTPAHGVPLDDDWDRPREDRLRGQQDGDR
jgi:hypothetical protein